MTPLPAGIVRNKSSSPALYVIGSRHVSKDEQAAGEGAELQTTAHEQRRIEIAATAARLFATEGVARCNMGEIAKACGIAKPTLYHYYRTRDEILIAINDTAFQFLTSRIRDREATEMPATEELRAIIGDVLDLVHDFPGYSRVVFEHLRQLAPDLRSKVLARRVRYAAHLTGVLERGVSSGEFRQINPRLTTLAILGMVNWTHQWYSPDGRLAPAEIADQFFDLVITGLGAEPPTGTRQSSKRRPSERRTKSG
jgi:AcrR family transcriptional regulator